MAKSTRKLLYDVAEGTPENTTRREPNPKQKTASLPTVDGKAQQMRSVTGSLQLVRMEAEGVENKDTREGAKASQSDETQPSATARPTESTAAVPSTSTQKPTILIVEDTEELAEVIQATLENRGMDVEWVAHGSKAIEKIKANVPDVLLLDIGLPDMTGWKMLEELREWKPEPDALPTVVVITAYGDPANRLIGKLQNIHSYLIKPFTSDEVEKVVQGALGRTG